MHDEEGIHRRFINKRVVYARWNPTSRRFKLEQRTTNIIKDKHILIQGHKRISTTIILTF